MMRTEPPDHGLHLLAILLAAMTLFAWTNECRPLNPGEIAVSGGNHADIRLEGRTAAQVNGR